MIVFWLIAAAMAGLVLLLIIPPMLRTPNRGAVDQAEQNIAIARQQLADLEATYARGDIVEADYESSREELEESLALDLAQLKRHRERNQAAAEPASLTGVSLVVPLIIAFTVPAAAGVVYLMVGEPSAIGGATSAASVAQHSGGNGQQSVDVMMEQLKARLAENPDDARGWSILARSSMQLERYDDAAMAFARLNELVPDDPDILVQYADALAMDAGGVLSGRPTELLEKALELNPDQPQGLWLAGMAAERRGDYQRALDHWARLMPRLDQDPQSKSELEGLIRNLRAEAQSAGVAVQLPAAIADADAAPEASTAPLATDALGSASFTVQVALSEELAADANPSDTVFVFARAANGPPMPLAAARKRVSDLPFEVVLDDSSAMMPNLRLSAFETVDVVARVSKSGQPTASSGDLEGSVTGVSTSEDAALEIVISRRVP